MSQLTYIKKQEKIKIKNAINKAKALMAKDEIDIEKLDISILKRRKKLSSKNLDYEFRADITDFDRVHQIANCIVKKQDIACS